MAKDPIIKYVEELKVEKADIGNPLEHPLVWGTPEEWSNIPRLVAKYCIHTQAHLQGVVTYLRGRSGEETTASLREYVETENTSQHDEFTGFVNEATGRVDELFQLDKAINAYASRVNSDVFALKNYCDDFKKPTVQALFKFADATLLLNDNIGQGKEC